MNYFTSCIYGDVEKYSKIKKDLALREGDHLYILGDILDGNDENPEESENLMMDIMEDPNVTLVLGDHEYTRVMWYVSRSDIDASNRWKNYAETLDVSGIAFNEHMRENFAPEDYDMYLGGFLMSCELSMIVPIGKRYFYLTHGCPCAYSPQNEPAWQNRIVSANPDFRRPLFTCVRSDPFSIPFLKDSTRPMTKENTIVVVGQMSPQEAAMACNRQCDEDDVFFANKTLAIGRHFPNEPITVVGIDAAGFFLKGKY